MERLDDTTLIAELNRRMEESRIAVSDLRTMTRNLEAVNEKLRRSEALKSDFLSNIRNEINNPLTAILGLARRIAEGKTDAAGAAEAAAAIHVEAFDLDFQLRNIFVAAEIESGEAGLSAARVDVAALVRGQVEAFGHRAEHRRVVVKLRCPGGGPDGALVLTTDPEKLQCIVANLLANALEFTAEGSTVTLSLERDGRQLRFTVIDQGGGIPEQDRKRIFDRFTQLDAGMRKRHRGHGLGLSITKALAELLGGTVVLAGGPGGGCAFEVTLAELETAGPVDVASGDGNEFIFEEGAQF